MSRDLEDIKTQMTDFSKKFGPSVIVPAIVFAVNADDTIHVIFSHGAEIEDARLKSVVKAGNKFLLIPKIGSVVQVAKIENSDEYLVIAVDEITEVIYVIDGVQFSFDENGFVIKKGTDTVKDVLKLIVEAVEQITVLQGNNPNYVKLTNALTKINNIFQ